MSGSLQHYPQVMGCHIGDLKQGLDWMWIQLTAEMVKGLEEVLKITWPCGESFDCSGYQGP